MKVIVVGTGFVGLPHGAISAEYGHDVYCYDIDEARIAAYRTGQRDQIERYVNEPGLVSTIQETMDRHLFFTTTLDDVVDDVDIVFMCLNTPPKRGGATDMTYYLSAAHTLARALAKRRNPKRVVIVNKSTVPIGTARMLEGILHEHDVPNAGVASNPEFLAQGQAIAGSRTPDRVVVGADTEGDLLLLRRFYSHFYNHVRIRYIETTPETAEAIKYVANTLLLTYVSFWNGIGARLAETYGNINMEELKLGVTADGRISTWGSYVSNGAGGSCFGKDIQSLIYQLTQNGQSAELLQAVYKINQFQKTYLFERAEHEAGFNFNNKRIALLGLAFKKRTNDMRDSASLDAVKWLLGHGVSEIRAYDPLAADEAQRYWFNPDRNHLYDRISYHDSVEDALAGTDVVYISTDWEEFRGIAEALTETVPAPYLVLDGRRMVRDYRELVSQGYTYLAVGGALLEPEPGPAAISANGAHPL